MLRCYEWFSEGFADYFARRILLEAGLLTPQRFADLVNKDIVNIADNPHSRESYAAMTTAARAGQYTTAYKKLSYYRGAVIALNWDAHLRRAAGKGVLADFVRRLYAAATARGGTLTEQAFFDSAASAGLDAKGDLERYIMRGEEIHAAADALGPGFALREVETPSFDPGFSLDDTFKTKRIVGVRQDGPADRAGLQNGQEFVRVSNSNRFGNAWYADKTLGVVVNVDGHERAFDFFPRGPSMKLMLFRAQ